MGNYENEIKTTLSANKNKLVIKLDNNIIWKKK